MPAKTVTVTLVDADGEKFPYAVPVRSSFTKDDYVNEAQGLIQADADGGDIHPQTPMCLWSVEWPGDRAFTDDDDEATNPENHGAFTNTSHTRPELDADAILETEIAVSALIEDTADESFAPYTVERLSSGTEDGHLWYVVEHGEGGERRMVSGSGWLNMADAQLEARDLAATAKLTDGQRAAVAELRSHCPAPGDFGAAWLQGDKVNEYRYLDPVSRDAYDGDHVAEFVATFVADITGETDSVIVTVEGNVLKPTIE